MALITRDIANERGESGNAINRDRTTGVRYVRFALFRDRYWDEVHGQFNERMRRRREVDEEGVRRVRRFRDEEPVLWDRATDTGRVVRREIERVRVELQ